MLVKELIALLEKEDENAVVFVSSDEEGNCYSKLHDSFGIAESKEEKSLLYESGSLYGLEQQDMDKNWLLLYPKL